MRRLARELTDRTQTLADRVIRNYSTGVSGIREAQWKQARAPLVRAARVDPDDSRLRATLRFIEGHLHRIDGDGHAERQQLGLAQREYAEALTAFREAAELRPQWPEPFLGLARTFIASLADLEKGEDAISRPSVSAACRSNPRRGCWPPATASAATRSRPTRRSSRRRRRRSRC